MHHFDEIKIKPKFFSREKIKEMLLLCGLVCLLLFALWSTFSKDDQQTPTQNVTLTESEKKLSNLLQNIEGVGENSVMICEDEVGVKSVVVVCEGANNFSVVVDIREAVSTALGIQQSFVKIYKKN